MPGWKPILVQEDGANELTRLVQEDGFRAVRFNPYLWPESETMNNASGRAMYQRSVRQLRNLHPATCLGTFWPFIVLRTFICR
jgi:hypothetical protein